ncbi:hypothetical protein EH228_00155 [Erwinia endophytica]|uniref:hypothetical protein n=1 Tax=Erwinia endophytica TaxID=1563158 RepID=UPI001265DC19|nr:hypothetical protein [Erwinia endophytica]KAB8313813.1 hypothetical protein EH228_00155 [Erwinia endophytica]
MFKINSKKAIIFLLLLIACLISSYVLTARYFPVEPDAANSPLVWRAFLTEGFSAFKDWAPTPDNWYFTTYPMNFFFFALMGNDGKIPLILSTSIFIGLTSFILSSVIYSINKSWASLIVLTSLLLFPAYVYTFGFAAHPFSHYSTNFFGVLTFGLAFCNLNKKSPLVAIICTIIAIFASASDPWFLATYFLPLLLTHLFFTWKKEIPIKISIVFLVGFIISMTHLLPKMLGLPIQRFKIMPYEQWWVNAEWTVQVLGKSMNLFFTQSPIAYTTSFLVWSVIYLYSLITCLDKGKKSLFICLFSFLTVSGIISSFIISYDSPADISARFFVNAVCFIILLTALRLSFSKKHLIAVAFPLYIASSIYSYHMNETPLYNQEEQTYDFIAFLKKNNLSFGYGDYWRFSNTVNWLSLGEIHISPVLFDENTHRIKFNKPRLQTMKSWLTDNYAKDAPIRQFVAIPAIESAVPDSPDNLKIEALRNQLGNPDETFIFQGMTIFTYNHKISLN